jgi:hypothetical protein
VTPVSEYIRTHRLTTQLQPFLVSTPDNLMHFDQAPFGLKVPQSNIIDPTRMDSEAFLALLQTLDARTFGPEGMPMDRWVFYDCCYMPGAVFGFAKHSDELTDTARALFEVPNDYNGLVPYAMFIAIPMAPEGAWMGHNLASISPQLPEENLKGLGSLTKSVGLKTFRTREFYGATQWSSKALFVHIKFGPLDLYTAYTPAHSDVKTLTYGFEATDEALLAAAGDPNMSFDRPEAQMWIEAGDVDAMIALQDRIEAGERFVIPFRSQVDGETIRVPVTKIGD